MAMQYWTLSEPKQWQAGSVGAERTPIYFACADCGTKDATIAGIISSDGTYRGIGLLGEFAGCNLRPALFCVPCFAARVSA